MTDKQIDRLAKSCAEFVQAGGKLTIAKMADLCQKCGKAEYRYDALNATPNWMNRHTCPECGHSVSR